MVQRDLASVRRELARTFQNDEDPAILKQHAALAEGVTGFSATEANAFLWELLGPASTGTVAGRFQGLDRYTRRRLLDLVIGRLGHLDAEDLHLVLSAKTSEFGRRFADLAGEPGAREALLGALGNRFRPAHRPPKGRKTWVTLDKANFRNSGSFSPDNNAPDTKLATGLGLDTLSGRNVMELRGDVAGHARGITYDFKREIHQEGWCWDDGRWVRYREFPAGSDDDRFQEDEDLSPDFGHLYVMDTPGPPFQSPDGHPGAEYVVYAASFVEWVEADDGSGTRSVVSNRFEWHSVSTIRRDGPSHWTRDMRRPNEIAPGPHFVGMPGWRP